MENRSRVSVRSGVRGLASMVLITAFALLLAFSVGQVLIGDTVKDVPSLSLDAYHERVVAQCTGEGRIDPKRKTIAVARTEGGGMDQAEIAAIAVCVDAYTVGASQLSGEALLRVHKGIKGDAWVFVPEDPERGRLLDLPGPLNTRYATEWDERMVSRLRPRLDPGWGLRALLVGLAYIAFALGTWIVQGLTGVKAPAKFLRGLGLAISAISIVCISSKAGVAFVFQTIEASYGDDTGRYERMVERFSSCLPDGSAVDPSSATVRLPDGASPMVEGRQFLACARMMSDHPNPYLIAPSPSLEPHIPMWRFE